MLITEKDGSILDMTNISKSGIFKLDLTIMDIPSKSEVNKLIVKIKNNSGVKKKYYVNQYLESFAATGELENIIFY